MDEKCSCKCGHVVAEIMMMSEDLLYDLILLKGDTPSFLPGLKEAKAKELGEFLDKAASVCGTSIPIASLDRLNIKIKEQKYEDAAATVRYIGYMLEQDLKQCSQRE
jgi:hypothetical protein